MDLPENYPSAADILVAGIFLNITDHENKKKKRRNKKNNPRKKRKKMPKLASWRLRRCNPYTYFVSLKRPFYMKTYPHLSWKEISILIGKEWRDLDCSIKLALAEELKQLQEEERLREEYEKSVKIKEENSFE